MQKQIRKKNCGVVCVIPFITLAGWGLYMQGDKNIVSGRFT